MSRQAKHKQASKTIASCDLKGLEEINMVVRILVEGGDGRA